MGRTLVEKLVRCYSPSGQEGAAVELLTAEMAARGLAARVDEVGNALGVAGQGPKRVYLIGHIDTVPGELPVRVRGGKLYGRGSVDAKGALATFVEAASAFVDSEGLTIVVVGCVGEEADSPGAKHLLRTHQTPDFVMVGEPSGWNAVTLGYKGSLTLLYERRKPRAHLGAADLTPAEEAVEFYNALCSAYASERGPGFGQLTLRLLSFQTREEGNHSQARLELNVRTPPGFPLEEFRRTAERLRGSAQLRWGEFVPAVLAEKNNELVRAFLRAIRAQGGQPTFKRKTGTSDMNLLQAWGVPLVAYGPGDSSLDHTPQEHLDLAEYVQAIAVLREALRALEQSGC
jgi:LysW-gamma-L-lysine carboxypeptidase